MSEVILQTRDLTRRYGRTLALDHASLTAGGILMGVSNSVTEDVAEIRVHIGTALVVVYQE